MSKKNYVRIANCLDHGFHFAETMPGKTVAAYIAEKLADYFQEDNPRFSRETFLRAAGHPAYQEVSTDA